MRSASAAFFFQIFCDLTCHHPCLEGVSSVAKKKEKTKRSHHTASRFLVCTVTQPIVIEKLFRIRCDVRTDINMMRKVSFQV